MGSYSLVQEGVRDDETRAIICTQRIEIVQYSALDDIVYLRWPSGTNFDQMGTVPRQLIDDPSHAPLIARCRIIGLEVAQDMERRIHGYLRQAMRRYLTRVTQA